MTPIRYRERLNTQLQQLTPELRELVGAVERTPLELGRVDVRTRGARTERGITLSATEARVILRCIEPWGLARGRRRKATAQLIAATALLREAIPDAVGAHAAGPAIAAACELLDTLRDWIAEAQWHEACEKAHVGWRYHGRKPQPMPARTDAITPIMRRPEAEIPAQTGTAPEHEDHSPCRPDPIAAQAAEPAPKIRAGRTARPSASGSAGSTRQPSLLLPLPSTCSTPSTTTPRPRRATATTTTPQSRAEAGRAA